MATTAAAARDNLLARKFTLFRIHIYAVRVRVCTVPHLSRVAIFLAERDDSVCDSFRGRFVARTTRAEGSQDTYGARTRINIVPDCSSNNMIN